VAVAEANLFQGVYEGRSLVRVNNSAPDYFPARMTVFPDGHSILMTIQIPGYVSTSVIKGSFKGNVFEGSARGRFNGVIYNCAGTCNITFLGNEARIHGNSAHRPVGYVHDPREDKALVFYRGRS